MRIVKTSNLVDNKLRGEDDLKNHLNSVDRDLENIVLAMESRIRFGTGTDGDRGENIAGEFQVFTTSGTPDAESAISHTLGSTPVGYLVLTKDKAGHIYSGTTSWDSSNIYLRSDVASVTSTVFLIK